MNIQNYHLFLFQWHCRHFFRFRRHMSGVEKAYLETCFRLARGLEEVSESGYAHFSYYSYSHRVDGERVNSSRLAYGSIAHPEPAWEAARPVLEQRQVSLPPFLLESPFSRFYGLGWDFEENQFKVYFRITRVERLPAELAILGAGQNLQAHRQEGLISLTFTNSQVAERKLYLYPLHNESLPEGASGQARMLSDKRGAISQYDVTTPEDWAQRISEPGQAILRRYMELNETLDTIALQDRDHYTLYFP